MLEVYDAVFVFRFWVEGDIVRKIARQLRLCQLVCSFLMSGLDS